MKKNSPKRWFATIAGVTLAVVAILMAAMAPAKAATEVNQAGGNGGSMSVAAQTSACTVDYTIVNQWGDGFQANVEITNHTGSAINGYDLTWSFDSGETLNQGWNATFSSSGSSVTASNSAGHWNGSLAANGGTSSFGFTGNSTGTVSVPDDFVLNGMPCNDTVPPTDVPPTDVPPTDVPPTDVPPTDVPPTDVPPTDVPPTDVPPTDVPPTDVPPTDVPPTDVPPTDVSPTDVPPTDVPPSGYCAVDYAITNQWGNGFQADVVITNTSNSVIDGYTLTWDYDNGEQATSGWNVTLSQSGTTASASNPAGSWNGTLAANGGTSSFGFQGNHSGTIGIPTNFALNGVACGGDVEPTPTSVPPTDVPPTVTPGGPTATPTDVPPTATATPIVPTPTPPPPGYHVDNPFVGATGYLNSSYTALVEAQADSVEASDPALADAMRSVASYPSALWMDRIGAITDGIGLRGHMDAAAAQQAALGTPVYIQVVIYDLPNRDCAAEASSGELRISEDGLNRYKTEYIDPIVDIMNDPEYANLRIVTVIEPDSLPNLVTNLGVADCAEAHSTGAYVQGIQYAVEQLHTMGNAYIYLDIGHSGWLGWSSNFGPTVDMYTDAIAATADGFNSIDGFITNTSNYTPAIEPFLDPDDQVGQPVRSSDFYEWNPYLDEVNFATALRQAFISNGFPETLGMLVDTSRNGWGGTERPTEVSTSTDLNTYVDESRIDRRLHRGGWCNQAGAGIGERPTPEPYAGIDAFVWVKPPGESDGISDPDFTPDPNDPAKRHDPMCDPNAQNSYNNAYGTNALPNAPHAGRWFPEQFEELVRNAYPPLD